MNECWDILSIVMTVVGCIYFCVCVHPEKPCDVLSPCLCPPLCNVTSGQGWLAGPSILSACKVVSSSVTGLVRQAVITPESRYSKVCQVIEDIKDTDRGHLNWLSHRIEVFDERWSEPTLTIKQYLTADSSDIPFKYPWKKDTGHYRIRFSFTALSSQKCGSLLLNYWRPWCY